VDGKGGQNGVEGVGFVGQRLEVWNDLPLDIDPLVEGLVCVPVEEGVGRVDAGESGDLVR
jgi:hypothetical protein